MNSQFWDSRYAKDRFIYGVEPNSFLVENVSLFSAGDHILLPGDGEGRNSVWLAKSGFRVTAVDYSLEGFKKGKKLAEQHQTSYETICADLTEFDWPVNKYDGIVCVFLHLPPEIRSEIHKKMALSLKSAGVLVMQSFAKDQLNYSSGGPKNEAMLYSEEMLRRDFNGFGELKIEETITDIDEGEFHRGKSAIVNCILKRT